MWYPIKRMALPLAALVGAFLLWFYASLNRRYETLIDIPIRLTQLDASLCPLEALPEKATIEVIGTGRQLLMLKATGAELQVQADRAVRGINVFRLTEDNVTLLNNPGVKSISVKSPKSITLELDAIVRKRVPVIPDIEIKLENQTALTGSPYCEPSMVELIGPRRHISQMDSLFTRHRVVKDIREDTSILTELRTPELYGITPRPEQVRIRITAEALTRKTIEQIPVHLIDVPQGVNAQLHVATVSLVVAGPKKTVLALRKEHINVYVPYPRFGLEGVDEIEPSISIIDNVQWSNLTPKTVKLLERVP